MINTIFTSKIDFWLAFLILGSSLLLVLVPVWEWMYNNSSIKRIIFISLFTIPTALLLLVLFFNIKYTLTADTLLVKNGFSTQSISLEDITHITPRRTNVIGALYEKMLFALDYFEHNINSSIFYHWCKYTLIPSLKTKCVIVMDNARFHKSKRIQKLLNRHGHRILWLPPYSPDLNPIEKKWAQAKFLRQGWMENNLPKLFYDMGCIDFIKT